MDDSIGTESTVVASAEPVAVSVGEAAKRLGISRAHLYGFVMSGELPSVLLGRRRVIALTALRAWLEQRTAAS